MDATGRCLCGAVTFAAREVAEEVHACQCTMCRRWCGGPLLAVHAGAVDFEGAEQIERYASSSWAERGFCRRCGSTLFYKLGSRDSYEMAAMAFDDPDAFRLAGEIFVDDAPDWCALAGDHERLTGAEFMARIKGA